MSTPVEQVTGTFTPQFSVSETLSYGAVSSDIAQAGDNNPINFTNGNGGAGVIDLHWEKGYITPVSLAASASVTYTLSALTDDLGRSIAFARIVSFFLRVLSITNGDYLTITPGSTHGWNTMVGSGGANVKSTFHNVDATGGFLVTASSVDQVTITNNGSHTITFCLALAGASS